MLRNKENIDIVQRLAGLGVARCHIATFIKDPHTNRNISVSFLEKLFEEELVTGEARATAAVASNLFKIATSPKVSGPTVAAAIFWLKVRAGWKESTQESGTRYVIDDATAKTLESKINSLAGTGEEKVVPFPTHGSGS